MSQPGNSWRMRPIAASERLRTIGRRSGSGGGGAALTETETKWSERVREWKARGRTAKEFAEGREFKPSTLVYWASCLRTGVGGAPRAKKREPRVRMARVVAVPTRAEDAIVIAIGTARVAVRAGFDAEDVGATLGCIVDAMAKRRRTPPSACRPTRPGVCIQPEPLAEPASVRPAARGTSLSSSPTGTTSSSSTSPSTRARPCARCSGASPATSKPTPMPSTTRSSAAKRAPTRTTTRPPRVGCLEPLPQAVLGGRHRHQRCRGARRRFFAFAPSSSSMRSGPILRQSSGTRDASSLRPLVDDFFAWAAAQYARVKDVRGLVATAFGYAIATGGRPATFPRRRPAAHDEQPLRARPQAIAVGRKAVVVLRLRRSRHRRRQPPLARRVVRAPRARSRGLLMDDNYFCRSTTTTSAGRPPY